MLEQALGKSCILPKRKIKSLSEFNNSFGHIKDIFIDVLNDQCKDLGILKSKENYTQARRKITLEKISLLVIMVEIFCFYLLLNHKRMKTK